MKRIILIAITALVLGAVPAAAQSQGDWTVGLGFGVVDPKSDNGTLAGARAKIDSNTQLTVTAEYFIQDRLGVELLAATPFSHDVNIVGIGHAGNVKHLPPTLSLNYHFTDFEGFKPYVGVGVNYTLFFNEKSPLGSLELDNSLGFAAQAGIDIPVSENGAIRLNARWIDIETDVKLNGAKIGTAEIDPFVYGAGYVHRF